MTPFVGQQPRVPGSIHIWIDLCSASYLRDVEEVRSKIDRRNLAYNHADLKTEVSANLRSNAARSRGSHRPGQALRAGRLRF